MKRSILVWLVTSALAFLLGFMLYLWLQSRSHSASDAIGAIPTNAAIVVKINSFEVLTKSLYKNQNDLWFNLRVFDPIAKANSFFEYSENYRLVSSGFEQLLYKNDIFMSVHAVGKGTPAFLYAANLTERVKASDVISYFANALGDRYNLTKKDYNGVTIHTYTHIDPDNPRSFSFAISHNVAVASESILLVESSIGQMGSNISLKQDRAFMEAYRTAGTRVKANVFVNHNRLPIILSERIHQSQRLGFETLAHIASWSELDLTIKDDAFYLNGLTMVSDTLNVFYKIFTKQKPVKMSVPEILPAQTAALVFLGVSNIETYLQSYSQYLSSRGTLNKRSAQIESLNTRIGCNIQKLYSSIFESELTLAFIPFEGETYANCWFAIANTKGQSMAQQKLTEAIEQYAKANQQSISSFETNFAVDREKSVKIYRFPKPGIHEALFGPLFAPVNDQYFTFIESYMVFGSSIDALSRLVLANIHNKQLSVDESFKEFSQNLALESNFTAYINPGKAEVLYGHKLAPASAARLLSRMESVQKIQGIAIQLTGGRKMIFNNVHARYSPYTLDSPQTVWETRLDSSFSMKPQLVVNHNTQNREIFVQDNKNNIYLINDIGRVLWKRPITEAIIGEVHQVDIYRNGRLQFLFNTRSHLYLVDRNGNNVSGFPVKLRSPATNQVAVFDYENNRNYRFFLAGEDRKVYVYDREGNLVTGWDFDRTERPVRQPVQHFRIVGRDFIVLTDENRPYILDRRGNERVKLSQIFSMASNSNIFVEGGKSRTSARFVTTDSEGGVRLIYLDGKVETRSITDLGPNHAFALNDVNGNGTNDYIFLDGNMLKVYNTQGNRLFYKEFANKLDPQIIYFHFGSRDRKLGVVCSDTSEIYLINGNGTMYKGFPLKGITPFSIGRFANTKTTFNLIVGSSTGYVLNYAVQ